MTFTAWQEGREDLPAWLDFDPENVSFRGKPPANVEPETVLVVRATDFDGAWAEGRLVLRHPAEL